MARPRLPVLVVLAGLLAACGTAQPSSPAPPTMPGTSSPTADRECPLTTEPGPADEPNRDGGDLIDMSDYGGGRWRLCLTEPMLASVEHTAWCIWTRDRTAVSEIAGLSATIGARDYEASISIGRNAFDFGTIDRATGTVASYKPSDVPRGVANDDGRAGSLAFDVVLMVDPETGAPPPGPEPRYAGSMRWQCADPPPPR